MYSNHGTSDHITPNRGINSKNMILLPMISDHSSMCDQLGILINLPDSNVSVLTAIISWVFLRPLGVCTNVVPLNVTPMNTILPFIDDQSLSV